MAFKDCQELILFLLFYATLIVVQKNAIRFAALELQSYLVPPQNIGLDRDRQIILENNYLQKDIEVVGIPSLVLKSIIILKRKYNHI